LPRLLATFDLNPQHAPKYYDLVKERFYENAHVTNPEHIDILRLCFPCRSFARSCDYFSQWLILMGINLFADTREKWNGTQPANFIIHGELMLSADFSVDSHHVFYFFFLNHQRARPGVLHGPHGKADSTTFSGCT
jgi:hypothetical protein